MIKKSIWWVGGGILVLVVLGWFFWCSQFRSGLVMQNVPQNSNQPVPTPQVIQVLSPQENALVTSPVVIWGTAPGTWFFEASLPVSLVDETGKEIIRAPAQAQDDWMTEGQVRFSTTLTFSPPATPTGYLVVENDNPSGLPEYSKSFRVKVRFQ